MDNEVLRHYDLLIDEKNDPVHDPVPLKEYMDKWDGQSFIDCMELDQTKSVLEIGVGTGRLALRVAPDCGDFAGIDISPKTIGRATENLSAFKNIQLICDDFVTYPFTQTFDVIYSSLTFMHFEDKLTAIVKIAGLLNPGGIFVLSIDKNQSEWIDAGTRKVRIYPDNPDDICCYMRAAHLKLEDQFETDVATIFSARKVRE